MYERKTTPESIEEMRRLRKEGVPVKDIAKKFGVSSTVVSSKTKIGARKEDPNWRNKANWPEWALWENLHRRYGKKRQQERKGN